MTSYSVTLRPACAADFDAVVAIERAAVDAPHWPAEAYEGTAASAHRWMVVAAGPEGVAGFAVGSVAGDVGELESVVVAQRWRRGGVGSTLCGAVVKECAERGATAVMLEVRSASRGAQALYASLGFVVAGRRPGYYDDPRDSAIVMRKSLGAE